MSNTNFYKGFNLKYSYRLYRCEVKYLESIIRLARAEEDGGQTMRWLKLRYIDIKNRAKMMLGYINCLWDFEVINEDAFEGLYNAYAQMSREAKEKIDELSEE